MSYTYDEALQASIEYFEGEDLPAKAFVDKYALRNQENELLEKTPDDMHRRLAKEFARIEATKFKKPFSEEYIYSLFKDYSVIIPQGSPIYGIGNKEQYVSISNCFVLEPPEDSYGGILKADEQLVQISKRRGGNGICLSKLRPTGFSTRNSSRSSTGTVSWMNRYSNSIREVGQDGRRGALMITNHIHHPDILAFASAKNDNKSVTGANISIKLTDEFLNAVETGSLYEQRWPVEDEPPRYSEQVSATDLWNKIIYNAWNRAEPGLLFWDNILRESPADCYAKFGFKTVCTNPCGEIPLSALDSCRLLAINLFSCVQNPYQENSFFDFRLLYNYTQIAQRLMDDLVDLELECIDRIIDKINQDKESDETKCRELELWYKIKKACFSGRRTGLGITALGDSIAAVGLKYGTDESIVFVDKLYKTLKFGSYRSSVDMAKELGPFPVWDWELEKNNPFINRIKDEYIDFTVPSSGDHYNALRPVFGKELHEDIRKFGRRNIANLTTAPTGTVSTQACLRVNGRKYFNTTAGIEPLYTWKEYIKRKKGNPGDENFRTDFVDENGDHYMEFPVYHSGIKAWLDTHNKKLIDESCPYFGSSAKEIDWVQRVKLQATAQKHVDHAISSTVNLPNSATVEEVAQIYTTAWKAGCKGITVYRDGSRTGVLIEKTKEETIISKERPKELPCDVHHITVKGKQYFVLVGLLNNEPYEVFAGKNGFIDKSIRKGVIIKKKRSYYKVEFEDETELSPITAACDEQEETITRLTSLALRQDANIHAVVQQLERVNGEMHGFARSISRALKHYIPNGTKEEGETCPNCKKSSIIRQEGCLLCRDCGWGKC